jgi:hypothetical protein
MKLEEDQIVWTCQPTIECGYDERLHKPRQVKLSLRNTVWYGHGFNYETGEIDEDSNATMFAKETNCFLTKKEAVIIYAHYLVQEIQCLQDDLKGFEQQRKD